jgi:hypothetical protein
MRTQARDRDFEGSEEIRIDRVGNKIMKTAISVLRRDQFSTSQAPIIR